MKETMKPLNNNVFVTEVPKEAVTRGGIIMPETASQDKIGLYRVLSVADDVDIVSPGDTVTIGTETVYSVIRQGTYVTDTGIEGFFIGASELVSVIKRGECGAHIR